ncbi:MAG TPA: thiamine pyrophosphate-dependent enzyme [Xanthobacteraceae bacterium]|nr:thiamine pyrophosphate-dependent enzyme [Xanthobacteraceae bacterium]
MSDRQTLAGFYIGDIYRRYYGHGNPPTTAHGRNSLGQSKLRVNSRQLLMFTAEKLSENEWCTIENEVESLPYELRSAVLDLCVLNEPINSRLYAEMCRFLDRIADISEPDWARHHAPKVTFPKPGPILRKRQSRPRMVITVGDGTFMYNPVIPAITFAAEYNMPLLIVICNNKKYAIMETLHNRFYPKGTVRTEKDWRTRHTDKDTDRTAKAFFVPVSEIRDINYDLSLNRYKETVYKEEKHDPPEIILARMKSLNEEIASDLTKLKEMLG